MRDDLGHGRGGAPGNADEANWPGRGLLPDLAACLRFYSRLPVPRLHGEGDIHAAPDFHTAPRMLPLAGLILALPAALTLLAARGLGLGPFLAAALAVTVMVLVTGALHEDGLADLADGCGGATRERRLEIMRDSRLGSYGAIALALSLILRIGALATLADRLGAPAAAALLLAASLSRGLALAPLALLPPARADGASASVGRPTRETLGFAAVLGATILGLSLAVLPLAGVLSALVCAGLAVLGVTAFARRRLGGQTGDVIGASQQAGEIAALVGLLAALQA